MGAKLPPFAIADTDGTPTIWQPSQVFFPNGTVTDIGNGTVFVNTGAGGSGTTYDARTPLLVAGTVLSILTDGTTTNFLRGDGVYAAPPTGLAYAPSAATYILQTNNAILPNAQILASLSAGLLKSNSITGILSIGSGGVDYENILTAGSPVLRKANLFYFNTDGNTANFLNGGGLFTTPSGGSAIVYAPTGATYILQTNNSALASAQILAALSNGLLKSVSGTGIISIGSGGVDYENLITVASPVLRKINVISLNTDGTATNFLSGIGTYITPYEARSPLLRAGSVLSVLTDGTTTNFLSGIGRYVPAFEARTPLLKAGSVVSVLTDGTTTNFLRGDGTYAAPAGGGVGGITWGLITNTATTIAANSGYIGNTTATITYTLPTTYGVGTSFRITEIKGGTWKIAQNALQKIYFGNTATAVGVGGYLQSTDTRDSIELVCCTVNSEWVVLGAVGNITFV